MTLAPVRSSFAALGVATRLTVVLSELGITDPFPVQSLTLPDALAGRDVCGKAKTGSGKTLAYGIPLIQRLSSPLERKPSSRRGKSDRAVKRRAPRGLVLLPTRELAAQVCTVLSPLASACDQSVLACYGGTPMEQQTSALATGTDIVVATPGRLIDLHQRQEVDLSHIEVLVLDEADRMADMGFMPQVEWLLRHSNKQRQTMLFSATLEGDVDRLVRHETVNPAHHEVTSDKPTVSAMCHRFFRVHQMDKLRVAATICRSSKRVLVFARTKRGADRLALSLRDLGVDARAIHGDLRQSMRERALRQFSDGSLAVLVATDVAARGIDVEGIDTVLHFDPAEDHKAYLHRSGRTARAGSDGLAVTLALWNELREIERVQRRLGLDEPIVEVFSNDPQLGFLTSPCGATSSVA